MSKVFTFVLYCGGQGHGNGGTGHYQSRVDLVTHPTGVFGNGCFQIKTILNRDLVQTRGKRDFSRLSIHIMYMNNSVIDFREEGRGGSLVGFKWSSRFPINS